MFNKLVLKKMFFFAFILFSALMLVACGDNGDNGDNGNGDPQDQDWHDLSVRDAKGFNGMVASASSYASKAGLDVLKAGGNAFDAAVAVAFALNVTEPNASGLGGGGFMVGYDAENDQRVAYNFGILAPGAATREHIVSLGSSAYMQSQFGSIGVPRFLDGWLTILEDLGTMDRQRVIGPAVELARNGFEIPAELAANIQNSYLKLLRSRAEAMPIYAPNTISPAQEGDVIVNTNLANTFELIIEHGREGFYTGDIALSIVQTVQAGGGLVTMADMHNAMNSTFQETPRAGHYQNYELFSMTAPSSGEQAIIQIFNMLEVYNQRAAAGEYGDSYKPLNEMEHNSAEYLHVLAIAQQLAFGDRRAFVADPRFADVPIEGLTSPEYAAVRWNQFNPNVGGRITEEVGNPWAFMPEPASLITSSEQDYDESGSTTHFSIIDQWGNIAASTMTINYFFGEGVMAPGTGVHLNNHMRGFAIGEFNPNVVTPFKSPISSMSPTIVLKDGESFGTLGSPGSFRITAAIVQTFLNIAEFDMDVQTAIEQPRIFQYVGADVDVENVGNQVIEALQALGYSNINARTSNDLFFGGVHAIFIDQETGEMHGGADRRRDGKALGY